MRMATAIITGFLLQIPNYAAAAAASTTADSADGAATVKRGYVDMRFGQLHYTIATPSASVKKRRTPLVLLHQSANTALEFGPLVREMGRDRVTIAIDTPGYGGSDGPAQNPTIEGYAAAVAEGLKGLGFGPHRPVDILGYHTGAFTAAEIALSEPRAVRRLVLDGEYIVPEQTRLAAIDHLPRYATSREFFGWFCGALPAMEEAQLARNVPDADWGKVIADSLRPVIRREYGHDAAFSYAAYAKDRAQKITQKVLLVAISDGLRDITVQSKQYFRDATVADLPNYHEGVFFTDPAGFGAVLRQYLD